MVNCESSKLMDYVYLVAVMALSHNFYTPLHHCCQTKQVSRTGIICIWPAKVLSCYQWTSVKTVSSLYHQVYVYWWMRGRSCTSHGATQTTSSMGTA